VLSNGESELSCDTQSVLQHTATRKSELSLSPLESTRKRALLRVLSSINTHTQSVLQHTATRSLITLCTHILSPSLNRHRSCHRPCPLRNVHTHRVCCNTPQHTLSTDFAHTHTHTLSLSTDIALAIALALLRVRSSHHTHTLSVLQHTATHSRNNLRLHILSLSLNRHRSCHCPCALRITRTH